MPESIEIHGATGGLIKPMPDSDLSVHETNGLHIWSVQSNHLHSLKDYFQEKFSAKLRTGQMLLLDDWRLIQVSPGRAFLITAKPTLPPTSARYETMLTDVSHGYCELCLSGKQSFDFTSLYLSADLNKVASMDTNSLRCRFGQYNCLLYWDDIDQVRILIERSYAQSFRDYLNHLMLRHDWKSSPNSNFITDNNYDD